MPQHFNSFHAIGNLTRDPELRYTDSNTAVAEYGLAINRKYKANGEWQEDATFVEVTVWGKQAENCDEYLDKGQPVFIDGRLSQDTWEQDGQKRSKVYVTAEKVNFLHGGESSDGKPDDILDDVDVGGGEDEVPF